MKSPSIYIKYFASLLLVIVALSGYAQKVTKVRGTVYDKQTKEPLPFVDVGFLGTSVGVSTDLDGRYTIDTRFPSDTLFASFLSYKTEYKVIERNKTNRFDFYLDSESIKMETVTILEKKGKYKKKNNPAIDLSRKVIENKYINSLKGRDYYKYDQQEKIRIDLNNITEGFKDARFIRNLDFLWDYVDTSSVNGKTYLPAFMRESLSTIHYRKDGNDLKEVRKASRYTQIEESLDPQTVNDAIDALYQDIDIYEEKIDLLDQQFVSPFAKVGYDFYRYYILDTTEVNGKSAINLAFIPAVKGNFGFTGNIFVSNDSLYTVLKVDMGIVKGINLNFVRDIKISQEFEPLGDAYVKTKDQLWIDYALTENGLGIYGSRTLYFTNFDFEKPEDESVFSNVEKVIEIDGAGKRSEDYWNQNRIRELEQNDKELYQMVDTLVKNPYYRRYKYIAKMGIEGYAPVGPITFGPLLTFYSFNVVEGTNLRLGAESTAQMSRKIRARGYVARAFKTDIWKYSGTFTYSFNEDWSKNPRHYISFGSERESSFPGQELEFFDPANFFLSFQRGNATRMVLIDKHQINYRHEYNGFAYELSVSSRNRKPYGTLKFDTALTNGDGDIIGLDDINTFEVGLGLRYAPNEQFLQGRNKRTQIFNQYPIINVNYVQGVNGVLGGDYSYSKLRLNVFKQYEWLVRGTTNINIDAGKVWGDVPYILQNIPRGNQTYAYQPRSYNMMNFIEFVSDQYASFVMDHFWYGYFLNRVPLLRRLELREVMSFKIIWGTLADKNNPTLPGNEDLIQFPTDATGNPATFAFDDRPYMEVSLGFANIFKFLRVDVVQRLNYLEHPDVPNLFGQKGMGIRVRTMVEF